MCLKYVIAADLMLRMEPWLNTTTGCTYPLPFFDNPDNFQKQPDFEVTKPAMNRPNKQIHLDIKYLKQNEGRFGNFAYGNITVFCFFLCHFIMDVTV